MIPKKVAFKTLGCRLNQFETDALVSQFDQAGYKVVELTQNPDVVIVNTCTVTNQSDHKSRNIISQAASKNPNSLVVVTGCMANNYQLKLESQEHISYVVDNKRKASVLPLIDAHFNGETLRPDQLNENSFSYRPVQKSFHTRAAIKIQDGCDNFCTFCIIPSVRGRAVSHPPESIIETVKQTIANGYKEVVVTGVNIGRYEYNGLKFEDILKQILDIPGDFRVRISSLEPDGLSEQFIDLFEHPKMTPHLHLCLQSGSEKTLLRMRRMYSYKSFQSLVEKFKAKYPKFNFTTDIIVGFPGETEEEFNETLEAVKTIGFSHVHTFKYSRRSGTRADRMEHQVNEQEKNNRSQIIRMLSEENKLEFYKQFINSEQLVLTENRKNKKTIGYGESYIPIEIEEENIPSNTFVKTTIKSVRLVDGNVVVKGIITGEA